MLKVGSGRMGKHLPKMRGRAEVILLEEDMELQLIDMGRGQVRETTSTIGSSTARGAAVGRSGSRGMVVSCPWAGGGRIEGT